MPTEEKPEPKTETVKVEISQSTTEIEAVVSRMLAPVLEGFKTLAADVAKLVAAPPKTETAPNAAELETAVNTACEKYITAAKLENTPEARAYFASQCKDAAGLATACAYYESRRPLVATNAADLIAPKSGGPKQYSDAERHICKLFGRKPEDLA